jgi:putative NADH-flavin reductase
MRIALIGSTGMIGSRIAAEARSRGHEVTGITRSGTDGAVKVDAGDAASIAAAVQGHDAVVTAVAPPRDGSDAKEPMLEYTRGILAGVRSAGVRRLVLVGGASSLEAAPGVRLFDTPGFPDVAKNEAGAGIAQLELIRAEADDLDWTYVSPAAIIQPGERTGTFRVGGDQLMTDAEGNSKISAEDYAIALVDELEKSQAIRRRISVAY